MKQSLIFDMKQAVDFFNLLPRLGNDEVYVISLFCIDETNTVKVLDTVLIKSNSSAEFKRKLELIAKKYSQYEQRKLTMTLNPRSVKLGTAKFVEEFLEMLIKGKITKNITGRVMKNIRLSVSRRIYQVVKATKGDEVDKYFKENWLSEFRVVYGNEVYLPVTDLNEIDKDVEVYVHDDIPIPGTIAFSGKKVYLGWDK